MIIEKLKKLINTGEKIDVEFKKSEIDGKKIPVILFLLNSILLRHPALVVASLIFGAFHIAIVKENV